MNRVKQQIHYYCEDTVRGNIKGQNITVAFMDTGMTAHPDLKGRVLAFKDCVNNRIGLYDDSGHGTHVGGIIAGNGRMSRGRFAGIAPEAELVVIKILDARGEGSIEQMQEGIRWIRKNYHRYNIRVVNLSVGARKDLDKWKESCLVEAVEELWDEGITVIVSAGNYGPGEGSIAVPGNSRKVITIGALEGQGMTEGCSGAGPTDGCIMKPELVAPGYQILSCSDSCGKNKMPYVRKSGTSMATPVVSGAAALFFSKYPEARNVELKLKLRETCERENNDRSYGWGCVRVDRLLS